MWNRIHRLQATRVPRKCRQSRVPAAERRGPDPFDTVLEMEALFAQVFRRQIRQVMVLVDPVLQLLEAVQLVVDAQLGDIPGAVCDADRGCVVGEEFLAGDADVHAGEEIVPGGVCDSTGGLGIRACEVGVFVEKQFLVYEYVLYWEETLVGMGVLV